MVCWQGRAPCLGMRWGGRGLRARPASGRSPSSFLPYWKGQGDSRRTQSLLPRVPITSAARGRVAGGGAAQGSRCVRHLPDSFQAPTPPWTLLETSAGLATSWDFRTRPLTGHTVAEVSVPMGPILGGGAHGAGRAGTDRFPRTQQIFPEPGLATADLPPHAAPSPWNATQRAVASLNSPTLECV